MFEILEIGVVHCENEVEAIKVGLGDPPSASCHGQAASSPGCCHTGIWRIALVGTDCTGGVAADIAELGILQELSHYVLGAGGAAYVTPADEEDGLSFGV